MTATTTQKSSKHKTSKARKRQRRILRDRQRRILNRIANRPGPERDRPMMTATNIHYELGERVQGLAAGGIGAMLLVARTTGLLDRINRKLSLLKRHLPYYESDHVLNIAFNVLAGGKRIEHLERLRNDEVYLNALGAERIPDPTTAGDFCRRFAEADVQTLMDIINEARSSVWAQQPAAFFEQAIIEADGSIVPTGAECKDGVDIAYNGEWGYHPLIVSLANTAEPLYVLNRSGNRPSHEGAHVYLDKAINLCRRAGFLSIVLRGDTDFTQSTHLDRWHEAGDVRFIFGIDARANLKEKAEDLPADAYRILERPSRYQVKTAPRQRPERIKQQRVFLHGFKTLHTVEEAVAEFEYRPGACKRSYRVVVLRKKIEERAGQIRLFAEYRYFFYITNDRTLTAEEVVFQANDRCDQENLIGQLRSGVYALTTPVDNLVSNWAYMVMASLAWSLKAWSALLLPVLPRHAKKHESEKRTLLRMEFPTFCAAMIQMPCQIVRKAGRLIYRLMSWNPWQGAFLRLVERLHGSRLC